MVSTINAFAAILVHRGTFQMGLGGQDLKHGGLNNPATAA
jgi:hypothetical protein